MAVTRVQSCGCCSSDSSGGSGGTIQLSHDGQEVSLSEGGEQIVAEWGVNLALLSSAMIAVDFTALIKSVPVVAGTGTSTFRVRVGGAIGTVSGTIRATITTASTSYMLSNGAGAAFANPVATSLVKVTAEGVPGNGSAGLNAWIRGIYISIG